ncbi:hypothetical protein BZG76_06060 [Salinivibrio sp. AR647]|uniref:hypothetical protein n=1 Tax=Salinivibrio sp. AR647 TaxID=1909438 RepID=UPI0009856B44|nr:hypothetical protein [Salinivibrio sp. AR647]OOE92845.1 hypothetical protein BZG76_06060 [Salinivibrio sp. AR647]
MENTEQESAQHDALLEELAAYDAANDPNIKAETEQAEQAEQAEAEAEQAAAEMAPMSAMFALMGIEQAIKAFVHPRFEISDERREQVARDCAPALIKYGAILPQWLAEYEAEIMAVKAVGGLTIESVGQVKRLQAEDNAALAAMQADEAANDDDETDDETKEDAA